MDSSVTDGLGRRSMLRMSTAVGLLGAIGIGSALAPVAQALPTQTPVDPGPGTADRADFQVAGTWQNTITIQELQRVEQTMWALIADGTVVESNRNEPTGFGRWTRTGRTTFTISFREFLISTSNVIEGQLRVRMTCTFTSPNTVTIVGLANAFGLDGQPTGTLHTTGTSTRFDNN